MVSLTGSFSGGVESANLEGRNAQVAQGSGRQVIWGKIRREKGRNGEILVLTKV